MTDTTPAPTAADQLRAAADKIRNLAEHATHQDRPRWFTGYTMRGTPVVLDHEEPSVVVEPRAADVESVSRYIAALDPALGTALADWLDAAARDADAQAGTDRYPLAVARLILDPETDPRD